MTTDLVTEALTMAWFRKRPAVGLMHHPDRGSPYARQAVQTKLKDYGRLCSLRRKGTFWDNAPTESWFNRVKTERVHTLRDATQNDMKAQSCKYIEGFYNRKRQHSTLGDRAPAQFLDAWISKPYQEKQGA